MVDGIVLLDKPAGLSSNAALQRVRRAFGAARAGHVGSLDPLATGMLPVCLGEATKVAGEIVGGRKSYRFTVQLGTRTATGDMEGEPVETAGVPPLSAGTLRSALGGFLGKQLQVPPMYSALKRDGRPLYELARQGLEVERPARAITIHALTLEALRGDAIDLAVECSKGTYVRTLAEDLARALGTAGHVSRLHRAWVAPFEGEAMHTLEAVQAACREGAPPALLPIERAMPGRPALVLSVAAVARVRQGQAIGRADLPASAAGLPAATAVCIVDGSGGLVGLGEIDGFGGLRPRRIFRS